MKRTLKARGLGFYFSLAAGVGALLGAILYLVLDGGDKTFTPVGFGLALAGAASTALVLFPRLKFAPFVPAAFYAAAFGTVLRVAVPSLSDVWNKVNFIGGNAAMGMGFAAVFFLCALLGVISCFAGTDAGPNAGGDSGKAGAPAGG